MEDINFIYEKITKLDVEFLKPDDVKDVIKVAVEYVKEIKGTELSDRSCLNYIRQIIVGHEWLKQSANTKEILDSARIAEFLENMKNSHNRADNYKAKVMQTIIDFCDWQNGMKAYKSKLFKTAKKKVEKKILKKLSDEVVLSDSIVSNDSIEGTSPLVREKTNRKRVIEEDPEEESCNVKRRK